MTTKDYKMSSVENPVLDIRCATCRSYSTEEKFHIVLGVFRGEDSIVELFRREEP